MNVVLTGAKVIAGVVCGSMTILADGLHSASDLATDVAVLAGLRVSGRPPDVGHHYGHRRVSTLVALFVGAALAGAAVWIACEAVTALHQYLHRHGAYEIQAGLPFWLAVASVPIKEFMFQITRYVGRRHSDISVVANAWHHRTDAFAALAAAIGLGGVLLGGAEWRFLDPVFAIILSTFLVVAAFQIGGTAASELVDTAPSRALLAAIEEVLRQTDGVKGFHGFRARRVGGKVEMDVHIQVDPDLTVHKGHDIASAVRDRIRQAAPDVVQVVVHVEPQEG